MRKRKKPLEIKAKEACFSYMMTVVALITLVFISRDMRKDDETKKLQDFALKPLIFGKNWQKSWKETFNVIFSET